LAPFALNAAEFGRKSMRAHWDVNENSFESEDENFDFKVIGQEELGGKTFSNHS
jgi:hypothetical protein